MTREDALKIVANAIVADALWEIEEQISDLELSETTDDDLRCAVLDLRPVVSEEAYRQAFELLSSETD